VNEVPTKPGVYELEWTDEDTPNSPAKGAHVLVLVHENTCNVDKGTLVGRFAVRIGDECWPLSIAVNRYSSVLEVSLDMLVATEGFVGDAFRAVMAMYGDRRIQCAAYRLDYFTARGRWGAALTREPVVRQPDEVLPPEGSDQPLEDAKRALGDQRDAVEWVREILEGVRGIARHGNTDDTGELLTTIAVGVEEALEILSEIPEAEADDGAMRHRAIMAERDVEAWKARALEAEGLEEDPGPEWACRTCGHTGRDFREVKYESPGEPTDYDLECPVCESREVSESVYEALSMVTADRDAAQAKLGRIKDVLDGRA